MARFISGWTWAYCQLWLCYVLAAPIVAGPVPFDKIPHLCPAPYVAHGVGSDLKTYTREKDRCRDAR